MIRIVFFLSIVGTMALGNLAWWRHAHVLAATFKRRALIRIAVGLWAGLMLAGLALLMISRPVNPEMLT